MRTLPQASGTASAPARNQEAPPYRHPALAVFGLLFGVSATVNILALAGGETLGTAESCTGGMIGARITDLAGSSTYFRGGIIAYSNDIKVALLRVGEVMPGPVHATWMCSGPVLFLWRISM